MKASFLKRLKYRLFNFECFGRALIQKKVTRYRESFAKLEAMLEKPMPEKTRMLIEKKLIEGESIMVQQTFEARMALIEAKPNNLNTAMEMLRLSFAVKRNTITDVKAKLKAIYKETKAAKAALK